MPSARAEAADKARQAPKAKNRKRFLAQTSFDQAIALILGGQAALFPEPGAKVDHLAARAAKKRSIF
nr:hypothetical protein [Sinimarinibacterium sp. NLF-5-8]